MNTAKSGARCMLASPRLELVGFLALRAKHLQMTNLVGGAPLVFPFHHSDITVSRWWAWWFSSSRCQCGVWAYSGSRAQPPRTGEVAQPRKWKVLSPTSAMLHPRHWIWNRFIRRRSYRGWIEFNSIVHNDLVLCSWMSFPAGCTSSNGFGNCAHSARRRAWARLARSRLPVCQWWEPFMSLSSAECTEVE